MLRRLYISNNKYFKLLRDSGGTVFMVVDGSWESSTAPDLVPIPPNTEVRVIAKPIEAKQTDNDD